MNHIVLVHPAIPQNTGNIMRTCVATNTSLHIIKPMSFELDDKKMKRAGLDYVKDLNLYVYENYEEFEQKNPGEYHFFTRYSHLCYTDQDFSDDKKEHYLFFGHEHDGIPKEILTKHLDRCLRIPMSDKVRSLNLSNCAAICIYEVLRQQIFQKLKFKKGKISYMSYNKKDIFLATMLMLFIISLAIVFTVFFKQLYYLDINYLGIDLTSGMSVETIKKNYDVLIAYQSIFYRGTLNLPDFVMSTNGRIHFEEVKTIFEAIQVIMVVSGLISLPLVIRRFKEKEYRFLKLTGLITIIVPAMLGFVVALDFESAFITFHQIVFRNNYWVFDYRSDPVINILPETFFMHCFIMIVIIVITLAGLCLFYYYHKQKQIINDTIE